MRPAMPPFERHIVYRLEYREDDMLVLDARLSDCYHDIAVGVTVDPTTLVVQSAAAEFRRHPSGDCPNALKALPKLHGLRIGRGMSRKINEALGGVEGCGNLRTLLLGMLPLALNAQAASGCNSDEEALQAIHRQLLGTCAGYARPPLAES